MNEGLCAGCGLPLTGMRKDAKYHGEQCRGLVRRGQQEPVGRFYADMSRVPRNGPMTLAIAARARRTAG